MAWPVHSPSQPDERTPVNTITLVLALAEAFIGSTGLSALTADQYHRPTVVLVHGAFAQSSSRSCVINRLSSGYVEVGDYGRI
jgi:hypothetical protein